MKQHLGALDVPQKPITKSMTFMRTFDQTGNVRDHKSAKVARVDNAQVRLKRSERIVSDFWPRRRNRGDKSRLACIRKSDQADVGKQFQLKLQLELFARAPFLMVTRRAIRRSGKMRVPKASAAAARGQPALPVFIKIK